MELIPILSTIILVATISTFILSIGAYILYKIRERKSESIKRTIPAPLQAELVVPSDVIPSRTSANEVKPPQYQSPFTVQSPSVQAKKEKIKKERLTDPKRFSVEDIKDVPPSQKQFARRSRDTKFFKYTSEGYIPTGEDKMAGVTKWR